MSTTESSGPLSRREFLAASAAGVATVGCSPSGERRSPSAAATPSTSRARSARTSSTIAPEDRRLVIVELPGGNDGLSTLVPVEDGRYRDLRPTVSLGDGDVVPFVDGYALHHRLEAVADGLAVLDGVGARRPSMSHFDMLARWWAGTPDANTATGTRHGFVGRLCDELGEPESLTGVSIGLLESPAIRCERRTTVGLTDNSTLGGVLGGDPTATSAFGDALAELGSESAATDGLPAAIGHNLGRMLKVDEMVAALPEPSAGYDLADGQSRRFSAQMSFASQLLRSESGVRVIHVSADGVFFDTHERHLQMHDASLAAIAPGLASFRRDLVEAGIEEQVLIATTSEFGRRARENNGGLDHGTASCMMLMGPVRPGVHGEHPSLRRLDPDGNLRSPISFDRYLATLAAWLDVDPAAVLDRAPRPLPGLLT